MQVLLNVFLLISLTGFISGDNVYEYKFGKTDSSFGYTVEYKNASFYVGPTGTKQAQFLADYSELVLGFDVRVESPSKPTEVNALGLNTKESGAKSVVVKFGPVESNESPDPSVHNTFVNVRVHGHPYV